MVPQLSSNERGTKRYCILTANFADCLGPTIEVRCVRDVVLRVPTSITAEHTVGADVNQTPAPRSNDLGYAMRQHRIQRHTGIFNCRFATLPNDTEAVDYHIRTQF